MVTLKIIHKTAVSQSASRQAQAKMNFVTDDEVDSNDGEGENENEDDPEGVWK